MREARELLPKEEEKEPEIEEIASAVNDVEKRLINLGCQKNKNLEIKNEAVNFERQFENIEKMELIGKNELMEEINNSDIIYVSDYHSSPHHGDIIRYIINMSQDQNMVIGFEMLDREKNPLTIPDREYKKDSFYHNCLGMDIEKYQKIIENIREANEVNEETQIEITGLGQDINKGGEEESLSKENEIVAEKISEMALAEPMRKQIIFYGENHLAKNRMPDLVREELKKRGIERKTLTIYHDVPRLYFRFVAENGRSPAPGETIKIDRQSFCIFTEHPLKKELRCLYSLTTGKTPKEIDLREEKIKELISEWKDTGEWAEEFFEE